MTDATTEPPILASDPLFPPSLLDVLPRVAQTAEEHGEVMMAIMKDAEAAAMFRVQEAADELYLALLHAQELEASRG